MEASDYQSNILDAKSGNKNFEPTQRRSKRIFEKKLDEFQQKNSVEEEIFNDYKRIYPNLDIEDDSSSKVSDEILEEHSDYELESSESDIQPSGTLVHTNRPSDDVIFPKDNESSSNMKSQERKCLGFCSSQVYYCIFAILFAVSFVEMKKYFAPQVIVPVFNESTRWHVFSQLIHEIQSEFPSQKRDLWTGVIASIRHANQDHPLRPAVILLVGQGNEPECLSMKLARVVTKTFLNSTQSFLPLRADNFNEKMLFHRAVWSHLESDAAVSIENLVSLRADAALSLHAFCDNENAPFKQSAIIMSMKIRSLNDGPQDYVENSIERKLAEVWRDIIGLDEFAALFARISSNILYVKQENEQAMIRVCHANRL